MRKIDFENNEYYHIYNRGVDKRDVFLDDDDRWKFFDCLRDFNNITYYEERLCALGISKDNPKELSFFDFKRLGAFLKEQDQVVHVVSYSEIKNHYHCVAQQCVDKGIPNFMHKVGTSYTNAFNKKYNRSGSLFQGPYKAVRIESEEQLLWVVGYVNGNVEIHGLGEAKTDPWSSYQAISKELSSFEKKGGSQLSNLSALSGLDILKANFPTAKDFEEFVEMVIKEARAKKEMQKYLLDLDS